jgi:hypothetical protein
MKEALSEIYQSILTFLMRALEWYEEGPLKRAIHSITRPAELRYADLVEDVSVATRRIENLAVAGHQAEQRDMHLLLIEMKQMMISEHNCPNLEGCGQY